MLKALVRLKQDWTKVNATQEGALLYYTVC